MSKSRSSLLKPTLCLDFDGVIHSYSSGWKGATVILDPVVPGTVAWICRASLFFTIAVYSSRSHQEGGVAAMQDYVWKAFEDHFDLGFAPAPSDLDYALAIFEAIQWPTHKPTAFVTIDDRALTFTGDWRDFEPADLTDYLPWNKNPKLGAKGMPKSSGSMAVASQRKSPIRRFLTGLRWALSGRP